MLLGSGLFAAALLAGAATYYVEGGGEDAGNGTAAHPWRRLQKAANAARAGDTVLVASGTYPESITFTRSGTALARIVFKRVGSKPAIIDGHGLPIGKWGALVGFNDVSYMRLEGFEIRNSPAYNVWVGGESHHLELLNLDIHDGGSSGIWLDGPKGRAAMSVISGNRVHHHPSGGITLWNASGGYYRIEGNEVWANKGIGNFDGIQIGGGNGASHHVVVKGNFVHDNGSTNVGEDPIDLGGHALNHHYLVEGNVMSGGTGSFKLHSGQLKAGWYAPGVSSFHIARFNRLVGKAFVSYEFPNPVAIYNNTLIDCGQCVMFYGEDASKNQSMGDATYVGGDSGRMVWKNNLFFQSSPSGEYVLLTAGPAGATIDLSYRSVRFQNNMYKFAAGQRIAWQGVFGPAIDASLFSSYQKSNAPDYPDSGSALTTVDSGRMFVNAAAGDFHLAAGSSAIDQGAPLTKAVNDGENSVTLVVDRASYFQDGYCLHEECLYVADSIVIGNAPPVRVVRIDDRTNTIILASPRTWKPGAFVSLPFNGAAPDIGAFEYGK
jgi:hypothetical protein